MKIQYWGYYVFSVLAVLLFFLEQGEMSKRFGEEEASYSGLNYIIVSMIFLSGTYIILNKRYLLRTKLKKWFVSTMSVIYVITVIWSLFYPLASRNTYGYILLPIFMFLFMNIITYLMNKMDKIYLICYTMYMIGLLLSAYYFYNYRNNVYYDIESASNTSYTVLYFLPIMLCVSQKWLRYVAMAIVALAIMLSLKRGGFIAIIFGVAAYFYISQIKMSGKRIRLGGWLVFVVVGILGYWFIARVNNVLVDNLMYDRMAMIEETGGSGRENIYKNVINLIGTEHFGYFLFGHGWCGTERDTFSHLTAHNDFLEVLYDFGIIAFVLYILMIVELFRLTRLLINIKSEYAPAMGASLAIFFVNSMVSHIIIYCQYLLIFAMFWGFISGTNKTFKSLLSR